MTQQSARILHPALENQQWDLAAHVLILAALRTRLDDSHTAGKIRQQRKTYHEKERRPEEKSKRA